MSERSATAFTVLYLRFKLRVAPDVFLAKSREAATIIASVEGLIWKIWIVQQEEFEMGGILPFVQYTPFAPAMDDRCSASWDADLPKERALRLLTPP
jgi:Putative mono-oxygenase ydhR